MAPSPIGARATDRFYRRFREGVALDGGRPRITTRESESLFAVRDEGLAVLFVNPPIREWAYPNVMPLGQGYVAAVAAMDGHRVHVLDLNAERRGPVKGSPAEFDRWVASRVEETLKATQPDVIGIGGIITQYGRIREIARLCKSLCPEVPIVLGGGIASSMPRFMLQRLPIEIAVQEEGELTFAEVLHRLETGASMEGVRGVAYRDRGPDGGFAVVDNGLRPSLGSRHLGLDHLPWPLRSRWPLHEIYKANPVGHLNWEAKWRDGGPAAATPFSECMIASRGCPYATHACDYCYASYLGKAYRLRSPREVVDEMEYLVKEFGVSYVHFLDDLLMTDHHWAFEWFEELRARRRRTGFEVTWGGTCRTNIIANDILRARKEGRPNILELGYEVGMRQAGYGVESGSPAVLKAIDKSGQTPEKIRLAITETQRVLGYADCSFMIGSPGETRETVRETVDLCKEIGLAPEVFFFTTAYPATPFWDLALEKGLIRRAVTGEKGAADDDIIEQYFLKLGEQGDAVRTNFSDLPDEEVVDLSWWAIRELGAQNTYRHPHTGDLQVRQAPAARGSAQATL